MGYLNNDVGYDDVYSAVQSLLDSGTSLADISLRSIRDTLGDRGSLSTISKHFKPIKARLERGEALDAVELSETDMDALRTLVCDIVERRTILERKEKEDRAQATSDVIRALEADLAMKDEINDDLEHQVVKAAFTDRSDVHPGPLPNGLQALQNHDRAGVVCLGFLAHDAPSEGVRQSAPA